MNGVAETGAVVAVFPGQGSQRAGMGRDFAAAFPAAMAAFEEASDALGIDMTALCFGRDPRLNLTEFTQPALLTVETAMMRVLVGEFGFAPTLFAGHSLGEYTALVAAGVMPLGQAAALVRERGRLMQQAVAPGVGAMAAVTQRRIDREALLGCLDGLCVDLANDNAPGQAVISGLAGDVAVALERLRGHDAFQGAQARMLNVSAPFHGRLMAGIEPHFRPLLEEASSAWAVDGAVRVIANVTAEPYAPHRAAVVDGLVRQVAGRVRWVETMDVIGRLTPAAVVEVGPVATLRGFFQMAAVRAQAVTDVAAARALAKGLR